jgi:hypothetical protein
VEELSLFVIKVREKTVLSDRPGVVASECGGSSRRIHDGACSAASLRAFGFEFEVEKISIVGSLGVAMRLRHVGLEASIYIFLWCSLRVRLAMHLQERLLAIHQSFQYWNSYTAI